VQWFADNNNKGVDLGGFGRRLSDEVLQERGNSLSSPGTVLARPVLHLDGERRAPCEAPVACCIDHQKLGRYTFSQ
jgi:hypothetical protein